MQTPLPRSFYERATLDVAEDLLGKILVKESKKAYIVETEAYVGIEDKACHAATRKKETCFPLWGLAGYTYIYLIYGMYNMLNISTEKEGYPAAVLIRAVEPISSLHNNTSGPGKLTRAYKIDKSFNNLDITKSKQLFVTEHGSKSNFKVTKAKRVGINYAQEYKDKLWRFYIKDNPFVSL